MKGDDSASGTVGRVVAVCPFRGGARPPPYGLVVDEVTPAIPCVVLELDAVSEAAGEWCLPKGVGCGDVATGQAGRCEMAGTSTSDDASDR